LKANIITEDVMKSTILLLVPIAAFFLLLSSGCSVAGYVLGGAADDYIVFGYVPATQEALMELSDGDSLVVVEKGASPKTVAYLHRALPEDARLLREVPDRRCDTDAAEDLQPGHRVRLTIRGDRAVEGIYLGSTEEELWYAKPGEMRVRRCAFADIAELRSGPLQLTDGFEDALEDGVLAAVYDVVVQDTSGIFGIPMHDRDAFRVPDHPTTGRIIGASVGLAIDIALLSNAEGKGGGMWSGSNISGMLESVGSALGSVGGK
jgi:hypothetical protein